MKRLLSILVAAAATMIFSHAGAANPDPSRSAPVPPQPTPKAQSIPDTGGLTDGAQAGAEITAKDRVYLSALKKCEPLTGNEKQACIDAARKKVGEM